MQESIDVQEVQVWPHVRGIWIATSEGDLVAVYGRSTTRCRATVPLTAGDLMRQANGVGDVPSDVDDPPIRLLLQPRTVCGRAHGIDPK